MSALDLGEFPHRLFTLSVNFTLGGIFTVGSFERSRCSCTGRLCVGGQRPVGCNVRGASDHEI